MSEYEERRQIKSTIKISINALITGIITIFVILMGFFLIDEFDPSANNSKAYWLSKGLMALSTFAMMISVSNITEESRKKKDKDYNDRLSAIDGHYSFIMERHLTDELDTFIGNLNVRNKYRKYCSKHKKKAQRYARMKGLKNYWKKKIEVQEHLLLLTAQDVWDGAERVHYKKITSDQLFAGTYELSMLDEESDLHMHKTELAATKLLWKIVFLISFGAFAADIACSWSGFSVDKIIPLVIKILTLVWAAYSGVCFGYEIMNRAKIISKRKCKIYSEFRKRQSENLGYEVKIPADSFIEKLRKKYGIEPPIDTGIEVQVEDTVEKIQQCRKETTGEAIKETIHEAIDKGEPVKPQSLIIQAVTNILEADANRNIQQLHEGTNN